MRKPEAKWQVLWNQYLREVKPKWYGYFELKNAERGSISFAKIELHQYEGLQATEKEGLIWKLSDEDRRQKPCDALSIPPLPSYIVIHFPDGYYAIRIKEIVRLREEGYMGITKEMAEKVAEKVVRLG